MGQADGTAAAMRARGMTPENLKNTALKALLRRLALDDALLWARVEDGFLRSDHISATSVLRPEARPCAGRWPLKEETFVVYPACGGEARLAVESEGEADVRFTLHPSPLPSRRAPLAQDVPVRCAHLPAGRSGARAPGGGGWFPSGPAGACAGRGARGRRAAAGRAGGLLRGGGMVPSLPGAFQGRSLRPPERAGRLPSPLGRPPAPQASEGLGPMGTGALPALEEAGRLDSVLCSLIPSCPWS